MVVYTKNNASQTVARARRFGTYLPKGYCARFCADAASNGTFGLGISSAKDAWNKARYKYRTGTPPAGAMVYWGNGVYGHIAVSVGGGRVRSTDYPSPGRVGETDINNLERHFGMAPGRYLGWSKDINGHLIAGVGGPAPAPAQSVMKFAVDLNSNIHYANLVPGKKNNDVARFEKQLWNWLGPTFRAKYAGSRAQVGDGYYGTFTSLMCRTAYAKLGMRTASYPGGTQMLRKIGFTHPMR